MPTDQYVAIDVGAEVGRVVLATFQGDRLSVEERHRFANPAGRINGQLQWNLLAQWEEIKAGVRRCAVDPSGGAGRSRTIDSIGIATWGADFGLIAPSGEVISNPIHFRDRRTDGVMDKVFQRVSRQRIYELTGAQHSPGATLYQLVALQQSRSSLLACAETLLFMPDLFNYLLTGKRQSEFAIAMTSQLYNPRKRAWAEELLNELELPRKLLPVVAPSGTVIGPMRKEVAAECRMGAVQVIAPASHDAASAVVAASGDGDAWCFIHSGTQSIMGVEQTSPIISDKALRLEFTNEGAAGGRFRCVKTITGLWLINECRRFFAQQGAEVEYNELLKQAEQAPALQSIIDPDHAPFRGGGEIPRKIERFCAATAQRPPRSQGEFVRTCLESLAMTYRRTLMSLEELLDRRIKTIYVVGQGARNDLLNQMSADACARPVMAGPVEAAAIGNALVQAMTMGSIRTVEQARAIVRNSFEIKRFEPHDTKNWDAAYARYEEVRQHH